MPRQRKTGEGGLYFDKNRKLWIGVVDVKTDDGRRKQRRVTSKSQSAAREKLAALKEDLKRGIAPSGSHTVAGWGSLWLETECKAKLKPAPYRAYMSIFNTWIEPSIGKIDLREVRPSHLRSIYDRAKRAGKSGATQVKIHTVISSMFEAARYERLVDHNVAKDTRPPRADKTTRSALDGPQMRAALTAAESARHGTKWFMSLYAGLRQGERTGATLDSLDLVNNIFTVQWSLTSANFEHGCDGMCGKVRAGNCPAKQMVISDGLEWRPLSGRFILVRPKSGEPRSFQIPQGLADRLAGHIDELAQQPNRFGLLWPAADGSPMVDKDDQKEWRDLLVSAGLDLETSSHWARHTAVSAMTEKGTADRIIGEIVGHKSAGVTARYQHISTAATGDAMGNVFDQTESLRASSGEIPVRQERP